MRHLYPVSILLYLVLVNRLYVLTSPHLHTNWLYNESPLTYYYKNTQKVYLTIIPRGRIGYEMIDGQRGA